MKPLYNRLCAGYRISVTIVRKCRAAALLVPDRGVLAAQIAGFSMCANTCGLTADDMESYLGLDG